MLFLEGRFSERSLVEMTRKEACEILCINYTILNLCLTVYVCNERAFVKLYCTQQASPEF